jgi:hypothetical protein
MTHVTHEERTTHDGSMHAVRRLMHDVRCVRGCTCVAERPKVEPGESTSCSHAPSSHRSTSASCTPAADARHACTAAHV